MADFNKNKNSCENDSHTPSIAKKAELSQSSHNCEYLTTIAKTIAQFGYQVTQTETGFDICDGFKYKKVASIDLNKGKLDFHHLQMKEFLQVASANCEWFESISGERNQGFIPELAVFMAAPLHQSASGGRFF